MAQYFPRNCISLIFTDLSIAYAMSISRLPRSFSTTDVIMKWISLFLLLFGTLFMEVFICILLASPGI